MADYRIETLDLSLVADRREIVSPNTEIGNVAILAFTLGSDLQLHFGQRQPIPVASSLLDFVPCPPENQGLFITHAAQPGVSATLLIGFGGGVNVGA